MNNKEKEFEDLVAEYRRTIYTVCYFYSKDKAEVEDLFQEVLVNLWRGWDGFRGESAVRTWVWRVSLNTCNDLQRRKKRRVKTIPLEVNIDLYNDDDFKSKQIQKLYERINRLDFYDRSIILLWLDGMCYEEIGDVVGASVAAITARLFRIKEQLKQMKTL